MVSDIAGNRNDIARAAVGARETDSFRQDAYAAGVDVDTVALPRSTTFVSPVTILTPASLAAAAMLSTMRFRSLKGKPSSKMKPQEM